MQGDDGGPGRSQKDPVRRGCRSRGIRLQGHRRLSSVRDRDACGLYPAHLGAAAVRLDVRPTKRSDTVILISPASTPR